MGASSQALQEKMEDRASICLAAKLQEVGGPLRVQGRELPRHGATRVHRDSAQKVFMRWLVVTQCPTLAALVGTGAANDCARLHGKGVYRSSHL